MDLINDKVEAVIKKLTADKGLAANFKKNPTKVLEKILGVNLPDDQVNKIIKAVTAKISLDSLGDMLDSNGDGKPDLGAIGKLGDLLGKK